MAGALPRLLNIFRTMAFSSSSQYDLKTVQSMRKSFNSSLADFAASGSAFKILCSVPDVQAPMKTLYVLDSSFNPPTKAHMWLATSALRSDRGMKPLRLLLLLAIKNADKAPKPADFEDRLVMMTLMAEQLQRENDCVVDVGITSEPFYYKKVDVIVASSAYEGLQDGEQVHITGFDTIIRIFDKKYYPDRMGVLQNMFEKARLRVHLRGGDEREQREYLKEICIGKREDEGVKARWAERIDLLDPMKEAMSSTEARRCVVEGKSERLERFVSDSVKEYILRKKLYDEGSVQKGAQ